MKIAAVLCITLVSASVVLAGPPAVPATPAAVDGVLYARTFTLDEGFQFQWNNEQAEVKTGTLLVLKVNPDLVFPRQMAEPVLYVGDQTAERINHGYESGHVIAIVPGEVDLTEGADLVWYAGPARAGGCGDDRGGEEPGGSVRD